jgi:hypothetical protein
MARTSKLPASTTGGTPRPTASGLDGAHQRVARVRATGGTPRHAASGLDGAHQQVARVHHGRAAAPHGFRGWRAPASCPRPSREGRPDTRLQGGMTRTSKFSASAMRGPPRPTSSGLDGAHQQVACVLHGRPAPRPQGGMARTSEASRSSTRGPPLPRGFRAGWRAPASCPRPPRTAFRPGPPRAPRAAPAARPFRCRPARRSDRCPRAW